MNTNNNQRIRINHQIRVPQVRVLDAESNNLGVLNTRDALKMAQDQGLDLIEVNPKAAPPVCKIGDFGKMMYDEKKKLQASKKNQQNQELKEITLRPNTDSGDLTHKVNQAKEFLTEGHKVKFTIRFRGREMAHPQIGKDKMIWFQDQLVGLIVAAPFISMEGKLMHMTVSPIKK